MRRTVAVLAAAVLTPVLGGLAAVWWLLATESGANWLANRIQSRTGAIAAIGSVEGTVWHGLVVRGLELEIGGAEVSAARIEIELNIDDLPRRVAAFDRLHITEITYRPTEIAEGSSRSGAFALPIPVLVDEGSVDRIVVQRTENALEIGPVLFSLAAEDNSVAASSVSAEVLGVAAQGSAELRFGAELDIAADFTWATEINGLSWAGSGRVDGTPAALQLDQALSEPVAALVDGELRPGTEPEADLRVRWAALSWPGVDGVRSTDGEMHLSGWLDGFAFDGGGAVEWQGTVSSVAATGAATTAVLSFEALEISNPFGRAHGRGELAVDARSWDLEIEGEDIDPSMQLEDWPGSLDVLGRFSGTLEPVLQWSFTRARAEGVLREQPLTATGGVVFDGSGGWSFDLVSVDVKGNRAYVDGTFADALDLEVVIDAPDLGALWPETSGSLVVDGRLGGSRESPALSGAVQGSAVAYRDYSLGSLSAQGELALREGAPFALQLEASEVAWREVQAATVSGRITGTSAAHDVELDVESAYAIGQLRATGTSSSGDWDGHVTALTLDREDLGSWQLADSAAMRLSRDRFELDAACVRQGLASLCASASIGADDDRLQMRLDDFDLAALNVLLPEDLSLAGIYNGVLQLAGPLQRPTGRLSFDGVSTVITVREGAGPPLEIPIADLGIEAELADTTLGISAAMSGTSGALAAVDAEVTDVWGDEPGLRARMNGVWTDLGVLSLLSPDVGQIGGHATLDVELAGTVRAPEIQGRMTWTEGQLAVPRWGFLLDGIEMSATSAEGERLLIEGSGTVGDGHVEASGVMELDPEAGWPVQLTVKGESLQAVQLPEAEIFVSPTLQVDAAPPVVRVSGSIDIPRARLRLDEVPEQAVVPSTDTVVHGVDVPEPRRPLDVHADLQIDLGDDVRFSGAGLDVGLTGGLGLQYESGLSAVSSGVVDLAGEYRAYGQALTLEESRLLFTGPLADPALDVRAVRRVEDTTVGVRLGGTVSAPTTTIFSEPAMNEADALAYLVLGRPLAGSGDEETATLQSAAVSMGLQQALPVIQRVGESLGFDEFSVQTTAADTGELMAGKQLSPRLYMRYSYGIFNRIGGLLLRLQLTDRISLETRSGEYKAMDLIYTVERE